MNTAGLRRNAAQVLRRVKPARLALTLLFLVAALLFARLSWSVLLADTAERALYDVRTLVTAPRVDQDRRIVMVVYTDETLAATGKRSPLDRALLARALTAIDAMRPKAIGIDILIDQPQAEDAQLIAAFRAMRTPTYLGFATNASTANYMQPWQEAFIRRFLMRLPPGNVHPASIRIEPDSDGVMRNWPSQPRTLPPLLANALAPFRPAFRGYTEGIRFRLPLREGGGETVPVFASFPIDLFAQPALAATMRAQIAGRYVLIGGDITDIDRFEVPATRVDRDMKMTSGLEVHADMLAQLLDGRMLVQAPGPALWLAALAIVLAAGATALVDLAAWKMGLLMLGQFLVIAALPFLLQARGVDTQDVPAFGWAVGWAIAFVAVSAAARAVTSDERRFAQSALGRYLPVEIANEIMREPEKLALHGERREIYAVFTDMEGFTKMTHAIPTELTAKLLNSYLDQLSETVLRFGGTIDKFVGDAIVAFWGAPIARADDGDRAAQAAQALYEVGEKFRREAPPEAPPLGATRVGLHRGEAIVGNFGGEGRIQYTALGDSMNLAARLEGANKPLRTRALVSGPARRGTSLAWFRPMGRICVRGRATPIEVFEPVPEMAAADVIAFTTLVTRFDDGDAAALDELVRLRDAHPDDAALANLVYRLGQVGPGGSFVLD